MIDHGRQQVSHRRPASMRIGPTNYRPKPRLPGSGRYATLPHSEPFRFSDRSRPEMATTVNCSVQLIGPFALAKITPDLRQT